MTSNRFRVHTEPFRNLPVVQPLTAERHSLRNLPLAQLGLRPYDTSTLQDPVIALTEFPQGCSSKFPTLGGW